MMTKTWNLGVDLVNDPSHDSVDQVSIDFGVVDSKGRKIGCQYETKVVVAVPHDTTYIPYGIQDKAVGSEWFALDVSATRDGALFGASVATRYFDTVEELNEAIEKYVAGARARALKNA